MKKILLLTGILACLLCVSCVNNSSNKKGGSYLSRDISYYSTPSDDAFGVAIKLDRANKTYTLYENSFRNQEWRATKRGNYSESIESDVATCDLHINPEHMGDVCKVKIYITTDKAKFISISSQIDASPCSPIQ